MQFQLTLYQTFCSTPLPITHRRLTKRQRAKTNKTMKSASPSCKDWGSYFYKNQKYRPLEIEISVILFQKFLIFYLCVFSENAKFSSEYSFKGILPVYVLSKFTWVTSFLGAPTSGRSFLAL